jgi:hypothetical protein
MKRGLVIGSRINLENGLFSINGNVDTQDLAKWLLYWDHITYAGVGLNGHSFSGTPTPDISFLESEGIFKTEIIDIQSLELQSIPPPELEAHFWGLSGNQFHIVSSAARIKLSKQLLETTGNIWSVGQAGGEKLILPGGIHEQKELIDVQLVNCLPVPAKLTPFEDILYFKAKYQGELMRLRIALDALREKILSSSDERRATDAALYEISSSLTDIYSALDGSGIKTISESIALYTKNPDLVFWASLGEQAADSQGIPIELGRYTGAALATVIKFLKRNVQGGQNLPNSNSDFTYAFEAIQQLK